MGVGSRVRGGAKKDWVVRCKRFAGRYLDGDIKKLTYCMKDVYNWKEWVDLTRVYKDVDYTKVVEEEDNVKPEQSWACSGGKCEII